MAKREKPKRARDFTTAPPPLSKYASKGGPYRYSHPKPVIAPNRLQVPPKQDNYDDNEGF